MVTINPAAVYETTWWEYVRDDAGKIVMSPFENAVSSPMLRPVGAAGVLTNYRDLPVGALWALDRARARTRNEWPPAGSDGLAIACKTIEGSSWYIDSRASNCTKKDDQEHRCWVRHGTVGEKLTVDKNGLTCAAGAGSFFMGSNSEWHGFLRDGKLTP